MFASFRKIPKRGWLKICLVYFLVVFLFVGGLCGFLYRFTLINYDSNPAIEAKFDQPYDHTSDFPKILHHSWKNDKIPDMWRNSYNACVSLNSGYRFELWTDARIDQFMQENYPWFVQQLSWYSYKIQKIDVFRYFVLYHYGGVYIDLDIQCRFPFSKILGNISRDYGLLLPETWPVGISNEFIVAKQHHPFFKFAISRLQSAHHEYGLHYFTIMASTGPMFLSRCLATYPERHTEVYRLPMKLHKWQYFDHIEGDSWQWWDMWIINWWPSWLVALIVTFLLTTCCVSRCCCRHSAAFRKAKEGTGVGVRPTRDLECNSGMNSNGTSGSSSSMFNNTGFKYHRLDTKDV